MAVIEVVQGAEIWGDDVDIEVDVAEPGTEFRGNIIKSRTVEVIDEDTVAFHYGPNRLSDGHTTLYHQEQINQIPDVIPASLHNRVTLFPFKYPIPMPSIRTERTDILWTDQPETVLQPDQLYPISNELIIADDKDLEIIEGLGRIAAEEATSDHDAEKWLAKLVERIDSRIEPGAVAKGFVEIVAAAGLATALKQRDKAPVVAALQGLVMASVANTLGSVVAHRRSHKSVLFEENTDKVLRVANALLTGYHPDQFKVMHDVHHAYADTPDDPHSPLYQGRWQVFFGIKNIASSFYATKPNELAELQKDPVYAKSALDHPVVAGLGIAGTHWLLGRAMGLTPKQRATAAAIQLAGQIMQNGTFTGDAHPEGEPYDFKFGPVTSTFMGGETDHHRHHDEPWNPRHADVDPGYVLIKLLEKAGLATIPAQHLIDQKAQEANT